MAPDWDLLRREGNNWLRYRDMNSRWRKVIEREAFNDSNASHLL